MFCLQWYRRGNLPFRCVMWKGNRVRAPNWNGSGGSIGVNVGPVSHYPSHSLSFQWVGANRGQPCETPLLQLTLFGTLNQRVEGSCPSTPTNEMSWYFSATAIVVACGSFAGLP